MKDKKVLVGFIWKNVVVVSLYVIAMWVLLTAATFLFIQDFWRAAGIVSAVILFRVTQAEFYKEFYGSRNPVDNNNAVQKQSKGKHV